eukprot:TRINITY_DN62265_c0_g1_i1.p1 TRINITY_DN62265_c0_g1~~TRINITY_DN62265_c0_g1_i1.p1  ORF type:complete len:467 (-),score=61.53 TRINITY_DN62265_c0_g1_i1:255-1655(-)
MSGSLPPKQNSKAAGVPFIDWFEDATKKEENKTEAMQASNVTGIMIMPPRLLQPDEKVASCPMEAIATTLVCKLNAGFCSYVDVVQGRRDMSSFALAFMTLMAIHMAGIEYGNRFAKCCLYHRCMWMLYALAVFSMLVHFDAKGAFPGEKSPKLFFVSVAACYAVLAVGFHLRVAIHVRRAERRGPLGTASAAWPSSTKSFSLFACLCNLLCAGLNLAAARSETHTGMRLCFLSTLVSLSRLFVVQLCFGESLPLNWNSTPGNFTNLWAQTSGLVISQVAVSAKVEVKGWSTHLSLMSGFFLFLIVKIYLFETDGVKSHNHALARGRPGPGLVWIIASLVITACIMIMSSGIYASLYPGHEDSSDLFLVNDAFSIIVVCNQLQELMHRRQYMGSHVLNALKAQIICRMIVAAFLPLLARCTSASDSQNLGRIVMLGWFLVLVSYFDAIALVYKPVRRVRAAYQKSP